MNNYERILQLIRQRPGLTDREIREVTGITPHQQVNQIANRLQQRGLTNRVRRADGLIRNYPADAVAVARTPTPPRRRGSQAPRKEGPGRVGTWPRTGFDFDRTLVVVPCSASKRSGGRVSDGPTVLDRLPTRVAGELSLARDRNASRARVDPARLMLACDRYAGSLYEKLSDPVLKHWRGGGHVVIISGGYGVVLANEPIGWYDARLRLSWWPTQVLSRCLAGYAEAQGLTDVVAFAPRSTDYAKAIRAARWPTNARCAWLVAPRVEGGGPMRISPQTIGEAVSALWAGGLHPAWRSSTGTAVDMDLLHGKADSFAG